MFYKNEDYTIRTNSDDGVKRYFVKYHGQTDSPEYEISLEVFTLYQKEFNKPLERQRNEHKRHIEDGEFEYFIESGKLTVHAIEDDDKLAVKYTIESTLKRCTPIQQRRYELHFGQGYSFTEIAKMENCDYTSVKESINAVVRKIKNIFSDTP